MRRIVVAVLVVASMLTSSPAHAGPITKSGPFAYVTQSVGVDAGTDHTATATCPPGYKLTGGGGSVGGHHPSAAKIVSLDRLLNSTTEYDAGATNGTAALVNATVTAICLRGTPSASLDYGAAPGTMLSHHLYGDQLDCPAIGEDVVGGGMFIAQPYAQLNLKSSNPVIDAGFSVEQWNTQASNDSAASVSVRTDVICLPTTAAKIRHVRKEAVWDGMTTKTLKVFCPSRFHVAGGGFDGGGVDSDIFVSKPIDGPDADKAPDDGWSATAENPDVFSGVFAVHALCVR